MKVDDTGIVHAASSTTAYPVNEGMIGAAIWCYPLMCSAVQKLRRKFQWGKWIGLSQPRDVNGRTIQQVSQRKKEITAYCGLFCKITWAAPCATPQALAAASILAPRVPTLKVQDMKT
eukprot:3844181-Amphidinium_carterae.1